MKTIKLSLIMAGALFIIAAASVQVRSQDAALGAYIEAEPDSDGDGVPDSLDKCPNTPPRTVVDTVGCTPQQTGIPLDSDGDGIPDSIDKCPNTPPRVVVDAQGCFPDEDGDGISDSRDACPGTPAGAVVDKTGCSAAQLTLASAPAAVNPSTSSPAAVAEVNISSGSPAGTQTVDTTVLVVSPGAAPSPAASEISAATDHSGSSAEIKAIHLPQAAAPSAAAPAAAAVADKTAVAASANVPAEVKPAAPASVTAEAKPAAPASAAAEVKPAAPASAAAEAKPAAPASAAAEAKPAAPAPPSAAAVSAVTVASANVPAGKKAEVSSAQAETKAVARLTQVAAQGSVTQPVITAVRAAASDPSCPWAQEDKLCMVAVEFDFNKSALKGDFGPRLKAIKAFLAANPKAQIELHGHTDSTGPNDYNVKLSMGRAEAVKKYLIKDGGLDAGRITTRGLGKSMPTAANDTKHGRASNRRTLLVLTVQGSR